LRDAGVTPQSIILEITETVMIRNPETCIPVLKQLRDLGVHLEIDDFGTGYSSLSCLHRFPLSGLKIDKSFIQAMDQRSDYATLVQSIINLAKQMGITRWPRESKPRSSCNRCNRWDATRHRAFFFNKPLNSEAAADYLGQLQSALVTPVKAA